MRLENDNNVGVLARSLARSITPSAHQPRSQPFLSITHPLVPTKARSCDRLNKQKIRLFNIDYEAGLVFCFGVNLQDLVYFRTLVYLSLLLLLYDITDSCLKKRRCVFSLYTPDVVALEASIRASASLSQDNHTRRLD